MKLSNQHVRPKSSPKSTSLGIKGIPDLGAILVDEYRVACHQHQIRFMSKCIQDRFYFFRQPKVILIAEKYDFSSAAGKPRLEGAEDSSVLRAPYQDYTSILQGRDLATCAVCRTIIDDNDLIVRRDLPKN